VVVDRRELIEPGEHLVDVHRRLVSGQGEGRHALQRHRRDDAEGADRHPGGVEQIRALLGGAGDDRPVGQHQLEPGDLGGDPAEARPGAVRPGRDRTGNRLRVDVAEVRHGQAERVERPVELPDGGAGARRDQPRRQIRADDAGPAGQVEGGP
jgi:hypothetical protein